MDFPHLQNVCPACAGMIRYILIAFRPTKRLPRMRGDDPTGVFEYLSFKLFAPHARG